MKLKHSPAPHIRFHESSKTLMSDVLLLLVVLGALSYLFYGVRSLLVCAISVAVALAGDIVCVLLRGHRPNYRDFSPLITGMIVALAMPATISYPVVAAASLFAIVVVKHPFGGTGHNLFNPAAAGISFAAICWPQQVFAYPMPFEQLAISGQYVEKVQAFVTTVADGLGARELITKLYQGPTMTLKLAGVPTTDPFEMLFGNFPGPMGATHILVLVTCLLYLLFRHTVRWQLPLTYIGSCALFAYLFPRIPADGLVSMRYELMSGMLLFAAVFMINDPVTRPKRGITLAVYGVFAGVITMLFRYFGGFEESVPFALLVANFFIPPLDRTIESFYRLIRRKRFDAAKAKETPDTQPIS